MSNLIDNLITIIVGSVTGITRTITEGKSALEDFFYVRVNGLPFIVLGARQVGKTTLIEWLRENMQTLDGFQAEPTPAGGDDVSEFTSRIGESSMRLKPVRDVGGEYAMWETDWVELFREAQPWGIIFMMDHTDVHLQKDALNFVMQMIDDEPTTARRLKAFFIVVNKADLWADEMTLEDIMLHYRNEQKRLRAQSERLGFKYAITHGSVMTGVGVRPMMREFFNVLRPKSRNRQDVA